MVLIYALSTETLYLQLNKQERTQKTRNYSLEDTHVAQICSAHGQAPLSYPPSLTKSKFMDKIIVNFKMASRALNQAQSPSVRGAWWDWTGWASVKLALSFLENVLLHSDHSSVLILCCITPFPPLFPGGHRNRALPPISCLMFKPETWTSFHILSLPQSPHSITNSYQCSCGSTSWLLTSPVSTAATRFFLQPLQ